jgi:hypothetical protein
MHFLGGDVREAGETLDADSILVERLGRAPE